MDLLIFWQRAARSRDQSFRPSPLLEIENGYAADSSRKVPGRSGDSIEPAVEAAV